MGFLSLQYSTSIGQGCGLFDAVESRLNKWIPNPSPNESRIKELTGRIITAGITYGLPIFLKKSGYLDRFPVLDYVNPLLRTRAFYSYAYNGVNTAGHLAASCYNVIKGDNYRAVKHAQIASKFLWRGVLDASLLYFAPSMIPQLAFAEVALNIIAPNKLRDGLNFITKTIDNAIEKVDYDFMPPALREDTQATDNDYYDSNAGGGNDSDEEGIAPRGSDPGDVPIINEQNDEQERIENPVPGDPIRSVAAAAIGSVVAAGLVLNIPFEQVDKKQLYKQTNHNLLHPTKNRYKQITTLEAIVHLMSGQQVYGIDKYNKYYPINMFISNIILNKNQKLRKKRPVLR